MPKTEKVIYTVQMSLQERVMLDRIAQETGRTPAEAFRRLIYLADTPEGRRALGIIDNSPDETK